MSVTDQEQQLHSLAATYGVLMEYDSASGERQSVSHEAVLETLQTLGAPVLTMADVPAALQARERDVWRRRLEPVVVDWIGQTAQLDLRLPASYDSGSVTCSLRLEDGTLREWDFELSAVPVVSSHVVARAPYVVKKLPLPNGLPWGYHRLELAFDDRSDATTVITTPAEAFTGGRGPSRRMWGAFLPLYAVHHVEGMGFGTYSDLETLVSWVREQGGDMFGTLPLLATFLNEPFEPSPYSPVSRRFWSEFYLDFGLIPELDASATAQAMLLSSDVRQEIEDLRASELVDYRRAAHLKRRLLTELSQALLTEPSERRAQFHEWVGQHSLAREYARFMATVDRERTPWQEWPERQREGQLVDGDFDTDDVHYHLYVQWLADQQISAVAGDPNSGGSGLYLDLPLGVHKSGFDVWRERDAFATSARVGAPPDLLNKDGQDWGFPPMHPERVREDGYHYFRQCIQHHLRHAGALRVDHVMGLHRLYWIPEDASPRDGVYVHYNADELYAILTLESHRNQALVIGEDLGTVPNEVRESMTRHHFQKMYVVPFQIGDEGEETLRPVDEGSLATLNTHDLAPFASQWEQLEPDVRDRVAEFLHERGWLDVLTDEPQAVLGALTRFIADSPASMVLVNLEDLWLETEQQNVPGTTDEHPNWRRKARYDLDAFTRMPRVTDALRELDLLRKRGR